MEKLTISKEHMVIRIFTALFVLPIFAQSQTGSFTFTLAGSARTSAGVYKKDSTLVRTLWANRTYAAGTYTEYWDGKDDYGNSITSPDKTYTIKVLSNNVKYNWDGIIGNTSSSQTGTGVHRGYYFCMVGMAITGSTAYIAQGYSEAYASEAKFSLTNPQVRLNIFPGRVSTMVSLYVATDGTNVYWAGYDATKDPNPSLVHATKVSDDSQVSFSSGSSYTMNHIGGAITYTSVIDKITTANARPTGMAVQTSGSYLFVSHGDLNQLHVLNKTTGALVQNLTYTNPRGLCVDGNNLWMVTGTNTVARYTINSNGTLSAAKLTLAGISTPDAIQVSGTKIAVTDAGTNHIVRFFNTTTGAANGTLGTPGGYNNSPTVTNTKFYFETFLGYLYSFIAFAPDGSFWLGDTGNSRVQHFSASNSYIETIQSMGSAYSVCVDPNNIARAFIGFLEFAIDYSKPLTGSTGWTLVKNWGYGQPIGELYQLLNVVTLSNGRTYGNNWANGVWPGVFVELTSTGLRKTTQPNGGIVLKDGTLQKSVRIGSGNQFTVTKYPLTGYDGSGNPIWSTTGTLFATTPDPSGNMIAPSEPEDNALTTTDKVVFYDTWGTTEVKYHLGAIKKGTNKWLWQTQRGTRRYYQGAFPGAGFFESGNGVNEFAGSRVVVLDNNIFSGHHGEFWKNLQTNYYNHYLDDGLAVGQFGTDLYVSGTLPAVGNAGNALTPQVVKDANGDLYLYHGDESLHGGGHRWKITNLSSITEQSVTIPFPTAYVGPTLGYINLHSGLPLNTTPVTKGWSMTGNVNSITGTKKYLEDGSPDVRSAFGGVTSGSASVQRDLGANNVNTNWKISGQLSFEGSDVGAGSQITAYVDVLDAAGKILTRFYYTLNYNAWTLTITANKTTMTTGKAGGEGALGKTLNQFQPFEVSATNGTVTFKYANFSPVTTTIFDPAANWKAPKTLRMYFTGGFPAYGKTIGFMDMLFYKDYSTGLISINDMDKNMGMYTTR